MSMNQRQKIFCWNSSEQNFESAADRVPLWPRQLYRGVDSGTICQKNHIMRVGEWVGRATPEFNLYELGAALRGIPMTTVRKPHIQPVRDLASSGEIIRFIFESVVFGVRPVQVFEGRFFFGVLLALCGGLAARAKHNSENDDERDIESHYHTFSSIWAQRHGAKL